MVQKPKMEIETIKKTQGEPNLDNIGKRSGAIDASITNRIETEERISGIEDTSEDIDTSVKENTKDKKLLTQNI